MDRIFERKPGGVNVTVSGDNPHAVKTTAAVIGDALGGAGFTSVTVSNPFNPADKGEYLLGSGSLLDLMRLERPEVFNTPVSVQYLVPEDDGAARQGQVGDQISQQYGPAAAVEELPESPAQAEAQEADIVASTVELTYMSPEDQQMAVDIERERTES